MPVMQAAFVIWTLASAPAQAAVAEGQTVHATRGVVKSIEGNTLVVTRPKDRGDIVFTLPASLHREGTIVVGAVVSVRYRDEGRVHVAIAVVAQPRKEE